MHNNIKMGIWIPNKLGVPNQTFIKYKIQEGYEKFFRVGEDIYSCAILPRQILIGKKLH